VSPATSGARAKAARRINFGPLDQWIGFNLRIAQEAALLVFMRGSKMFGERPGRFGTLTIIANNPGISQTDLSSAAGRDKSSITPVVEDLVRRGLVDRTRATSDRRTYRLSLTTAGKKALKSMERYVRDHERKLDRIVGARDRKKFVAILKRIAVEIS
jgi:DNA-binding MarR family transcriptional regulator